jgi:hypothetical protein
MTLEKKSNIKENDPADAEMDAKITARSKDGELPCAVAFDLADQLCISPAVVGKVADRLKISLIKCQLGLFGYKPEKKIVEKPDVTDPAIEAAIRDALVNDRLPCQAAWKIAKTLNTGKMTVSNTCETLSIKIKSCQLGAF